MLSRDDLLRGMRTEGPDSPVGRLVRLDVSPIEASMPLDAALQRMSATRQSALPVMMRGRLVGMLTLENIRELLLVQGGSPAPRRYGVGGGVKTRPARTVAAALRGGGDRLRAVAGHAGPRWHDVRPGVEFSTFAGDRGAATARRPSPCCAAIPRA